ncbi:MAG: hypothetical protein KF721_04290 [Ignavibacteriaceae bacterium]|nr:hypothetical protein [Ignavibacteriaceae bacterium]
MRVLKNTAQSYSSFSKSLEHLTRKGDRKANLRLVKMENEKSFEEDSNLFNQTFQSLYQLQQKCIDTVDLRTVVELFRIELRKVIAFKDAVFFMFDEKTQSFSSIEETSDSSHDEFINNLYSEGIIDWIWDSRKAKLIQNENGNERVINNLIFPIYNNKQNWGVFSVLTPMQKFANGQFEEKVISLLIGTVITKIQSLLQKNELAAVYSELQAAQSKLANDFKLSAIGELTSGIFEEIISPLQVIMSYTEFIQKEYEDIDESVIESIKKQISHIKGLINRVVKFAEVNGQSIKITSVNLNEALSEFHKLTSSSFKASSYETVLDLESNLPPILSNNNFVNQLLINILSIIKPFMKMNGGILFQTKYANENVILKIVTTDYIDLSQINEKDLGIRIIRNIIKRHEGGFQLKSEPQTGSVIILSFPLKRKMR